MITGAEVYHTLKFIHEEDVRRGACNVGNEKSLAPSVQLNNETLDFITDPLKLDQSVLPRCESRVVSRTRSVFCCSIQPCAETCCGEKRFTSLESSVF